MNVCVLWVVVSLCVPPPSSPFPRPTFLQCRKFRRGNPRRVTQRADGDTIDLLSLLFVAYRVSFSSARISRSKSHGNAADTELIVNK